MAVVVESKKACAVNPLKMSQPLGASFAFMGLDACMPVMHGSQGCTSFGLVLLVRHFKEAIPLQTTAMNEVTTILGGYENIEAALLNIRKRAAPKIIAICSTGLTETKGDDVDGYLATVRKRKPELDDTEFVYVSTPDYVGGFEDGYRHAVAAIVKTLVKPLPTVARQVTLLPGSHLSPGDIDELREIVGAFGLDAIVLPDLSRSLDGHIAPDWRGTTLGGTTLDQIRAAGASAFTIGVGEQTREGAQALQTIAGTPFDVFERLTGLEPNDRLLLRLAQLAGRPVPEKYRRQRSQLLDAMLDGHFYTGGIKVALGAEPDLLLALGALLHEMGAELTVCISTTASPSHAWLPAREVVLGDLEDMERAAAGCDLLITHSHGRQMAERLGKPLLRAGFPVFDRVGNAHRCQVGYRGTMNLIFEIANLMIEQIPHRHPGDWPLPQASVDLAARDPAREVKIPVVAAGT
ncbi:nitrogenase iron-molybdenum cofactor biosynthesis protein NifN [Paraburkholderia caballeronis]|uniref:Nitrogenase iron-molybdenum cofactor biosynthesis protein NifN n=1 Tax=Paraburkholderia caballeronis TaxID=416943 RepID=A0A1H7F7M0_9BURK|nr:nitrogenase iron-molybdenum cofactor biosynthesis protein NifN [Paraburkholderia caballeronis]PXW23983.1 nitrogenase molybdenum-iron protein NifN [Paraburkholderia caballeronis]PXW99747.1 nitrogenase molybdenum-iron protein NifN [Paraburkholderia caballeronis]RAJ96701.1 nitrogenase molybdenum-iron protein NifN [Paraburkholderia caballeronis]SEE76616.1 nitrogenase molybdenum-iron protein NifN [Paraburkholderia caballeronis]SEK21367.1 nitrogenase molybdenum-iron protein NifN [Paraburkholderia